MISTWFPQWFDPHVQYLEIVETVVAFETENEKNI